MTIETSPATVDDAGARVERTVFIRAPRSTVWAALTVPELIGEWFSDSAELSALEVGGTGTLTWDDAGAYPWVIVEVDAPTLLAFRGGDPGVAIDEDNSTLARFTLTDQPAGPC